MEEVAFASELELGPHVALIYVDGPHAWHEGLVTWPSLGVGLPRFSLPTMITA